MKVLVTGGAGYVGSHVSKSLIEMGHKVVILDNLSTGHKESLPKDAIFVSGDIRDTGFLSYLLKKESVQGVVHCAAKIYVPQSFLDPLGYYDVNVLGTLSLLTACRECGIEFFVFSSTCSVYGDTNSEPLRETAALSPQSPYASSKMMAEKIIQDFLPLSKMRAVILRGFNVAGASSAPMNGERSKQSTHLIKMAARAACRKIESLEVLGQDYRTPDGTCIRDYMHVQDFAHLHALSLEKIFSGGPSAILNCGYGVGYSVLDVAKSMKRVSGVDFPLRLSQKRPGDAACLVADNQLVREYLNWTPVLNSLDLICKSAWEWEKILDEGSQDDKT